MIYEIVPDGEPLRQGDIFKQLPRVDVSLSELVVLAQDAESSEIDIRPMSWPDVLRDEEVSEQTDENGESTNLVRAVLPVTSIAAIIVTQDCDAVRADDISLCQITPLAAVHGGSAALNSPKKWAKFLTQQASDHVRWLYLPADTEFGFSERMAVDFRSIIRLPREDLEGLKNLRVGRLRKEAYEHFREKVAHFFRRYAYDPWYPLTKDEFVAYVGEYDEPVKPYPWQETGE
jgi:hypothetical protein